MSKNELIVESGLNNLLHTCDTKPKLEMMCEVELLHFMHVSRECSVVKTSNAVHKKYVMLRGELVKLTYNACNHTEYLEKHLSKFRHSWREVIVLTKCEGT